MPGLSLLGYCSIVLKTGMLLWRMGARINTSNIFGEERGTWRKYEGAAPADRERFLQSIVPSISSPCLRLLK